MEQFAREMPNRFPEHFQVTVHGLNEWVIERMGHTLVLLLGGVALLLAIGCGNVSILLLARGTVREHELAVPTAVGAGRGRIVRQLLTESILLAMTGAAMVLLWPMVRSRPSGSFCPSTSCSPRNPQSVLTCPSSFSALA